jgi:hypothetical protein
VAGGDCGHGGGRRGGGGGGGELSDKRQQFAEDMANSAEAYANWRYEWAKIFLFGGGNGHLNQDTPQDEEGLPEGIQLLNPDEPIPMYMLDFNIPYDVDEKEFNERIELAKSYAVYLANISNQKGNAPLLTCIHGYGTSDQSATNGYENVAKWFNNTYQHSQSNLPILVGINWNTDGGQGIEYHSNPYDVEKMALVTGIVLGEFIATYHANAPESMIGFHAHSMGNIVGMTVVQVAATPIALYIAVQAAVPSELAATGQMFQELVNPLTVDYLTVTTNNNDWVLDAYQSNLGNGPYLAQLINPPPNDYSNVEILGLNGTTSSHGNLHVESLDNVSNTQSEKDNDHFSFDPIASPDIATVLSNSLSNSLFSLVP